MHVQKSLKIPIRLVFAEEEELFPVLERTTEFHIGGCPIENNWAHL